MSRLEIDLTLDREDFSLAVSHAFDLSGITALFGPSGSGKSTLLRIIAGLEGDAAGLVRYAGEVWQAERSFTPAHERGVGYVFQDVRLFAHLSVRGNLHYAERRARANGPQIEREDVVAALDLAPLMDRRPASLSGGEQQRVAIGRALLARPRLLLMDEPMAALDSHRKAGFLDYIGMLPARFGIPIIYVTHSIDEVTQLADRIVAINKGRVLAAGSVFETLERLDVATATGKFEAGVVVQATVRHARDRDYLATLSLAGQALQMPAAHLEAGQEIRLRIRARDVALATERPVHISIRNILSARIVDITEEPQTAFAEVLLDIGEGQRLRARVTRATIRDLGLEPAQEVFALVKSIAFDRRSTRRLTQATSPGKEKG